MQGSAERAAEATSMKGEVVRAAEATSMQGEATSIQGTAERGAEATSMQGEVIRANDDLRTTVRRVADLGLLKQICLPSGDNAPKAQACRAKSSEPSTS